MESALGCNRVLEGDNLPLHFMKNGEMELPEVTVMRKLWGWFWPITTVILVTMAMMKWVVSLAIVPSASMVPTLPSPSFILVNHLATEFGNPFRGEVVLFPWPDNPKEIFVKRIIGMPGDTVYMKSGYVYINGKKLIEPYIHVNTVGTFGPYHVPPNDYFMLGDNRNNSEDSRYWKKTYVSRQSIIGQAQYILLPFGRIGGINNQKK